jgi:hypothetical protein
MVSASTVQPWHGGSGNQWQLMTVGSNLGLMGSDLGSFFILF